MNIKPTAQPAPALRALAARRRHAPGFTLIELLTVIFIIALLLTIGVVAGQRLVQNSREAATRTLLASTMGVLKEIEIQNNGKLDHLNNLPSGGPSDNGNREIYGERIVYAAKLFGDSEANRALQQLRAHDALEDRDGDGAEEIYDAWGTPLIYARKNEAGMTGRLSYLPNHDAPFVASAGPDKQWDTDDDLYSFDIQ